MKYIRQFAVIAGVSLLGEVLHALIPLPIPASIYGLVLMLLLLVAKIIKVSDVSDTAHFLLAVMPVLFVPAAVGLVSIYAEIRSRLLVYMLVMAVSTVVVMAVTGLITQLLVRRGERRDEK